MKRIYPIIFIIFLLATSCNRQSIQQFEGSAFGTIYHVTYLGPKDERLPQEVDSVLNSINTTFSIFDTNSMISRINRNEVVALNEDFIKILQLSQTVSRETDGAFDFTCQPLIELWGFGRENQKHIVPQNEIDSVQSFVGYKMVNLNYNMVEKTDDRIQLNFNAIAKGFAVDKVSNYLKHKGFRNSIIEIGGEIVTSGSKNGRPWTVGIQKPTETPDGPVESTETFNLQDKAVATSGNYRNFFTKNGVRYTHILNPVTGKPEQSNLLSVTVIAPDCATADAYATAFMVLGIQRSIEILKKHPELHAWFIYDNNGILLTKEIH